MLYALCLGGNDRTQRRSCGNSQAIVLSPLATEGSPDCRRPNPLKTNNAARRRPFFIIITYLFFGSLSKKPIPKAGASRFGDQISNSVFGLLHRQGHQNPSRSHLLPFPLCFMLRGVMTGHNGTPEPMSTAPQREYVCHFPPFFLAWLTARRWRCGRAPH